jgi:hypothetical protein
MHTIKRPSSNEPGRFVYHLTATCQIRRLKQEALAT